MSSATDFIPLARAAAIVHERLFPEHPGKDAKTLDVIALALSTLMPLYQRDMESGALHALAEAELAAGRFTRGATTLEFPDRPPLRYLGSAQFTCSIQSRAYPARTYAAWKQLHLPAIKIRCNLSADSVDSQSGCALNDRF